MWVQRSLEFLPTVYTVLAAFLVTKSLTEAMEGRQGLVLASSLRVPSIIVGKAQWGDLERGHMSIHSEEAESEECWYPASFLLFMKFRTPKPGKVAAHT